jgi:uncharacterized protein YjbI with pentapeptide repeats
MPDGEQSGLALMEIFTDREKQQLAGLRVRCFEMNRVDFVQANLRNARFEEVSLYGCDFSGADLRGAQFICCDLRRARFRGAFFACNNFTGSWFISATGVSPGLRRYIRERGGHFLYC